MPKSLLDNWLTFAGAVVAVASILLGIGLYFDSKFEEIQDIVIEEFHTHNGDASTSRDDLNRLLGEIKGVVDTSAILCKERK